jgi:hypothetical protein
MPTDYHQARFNLLKAAHSVIGHTFDEAEDPGWQGELDDEQFDKAAIEYADALKTRNYEKEREKRRIAKVKYPGVE